MVKACVEHIVQVPIEEAWEILASFLQVQKIHPLVGKVDRLSSKDPGLCLLYDSNQVVEKITDWDESQHDYTIQLIGGTLPMETVEVVLKALPNGTRQTKLVANLKVCAKFGLLGHILELLIIKSQLGTRPTLRLKRASSQRPRHWSPDEATSHFKYQ